MNCRHSVLIILHTIFWCSSPSAQEVPGSPPSENLSVINTEESLILEPNYDDQDIEPMEMPSVSDQELQNIIEQPFIHDNAEIIINPVDPEDHSLLSIYGNVTRANVNQDPYKRAGKLYMKFGNSTSSCTATHVGSNDVIMTAAHCVYNRETQKFADNISFHRAHAGGRGEAFNWHCIGIKRGWQSPNPLTWDFAFIKMKRSSSQGALGLRTGLAIREWISIGYPRNFDNAKYMQTVRGRKGVVGGGIAEMSDNPMTFGASGGAWIDGLHVIGLNSFLKGDHNTSKSLYGPVFNNHVVDLFNYVNRGCIS